MKLDKWPHFSSTFSALLFQNQFPIFCCPLFHENYLSPQARINKMLNILSITTLVLHNSHIHNSRIHTLIFLWTRKGFISPEYFLNFFLNLYIPPWLWKSFKVIVLRLLQYICESKNWICSFLIMPPSKTLSQVFIIILQADGNCPFLPNSVFEDIFSWGEREERIMDLKELPKLTKVLVTSFDKFHHLCNLYIFGLCFVVQ